MSEAGTPVNDASLPGDEAAQAVRTLALLDAQVLALRAELVALREELAQLQSHFDTARGLQLLEANEALVLATVRAQTIADAARDGLAELARSTRAAAAAVSADRQGQLRDLRDANEKLVLAVLTSQTLEADAQEAHRRQITFLAMVAHELRNPLMPLAMAAKLLDRARLDEQLLLKLQATINGQVAHMTRLVADLLDGSRVSAGKFRLEHAAVDLAEILERAIDTRRALMESRRQRFTHEACAVPVIVQGDAMRLAQVFGNLLDNASKYTPEGGLLALSVAVRGKTAVVTIADNGIGITAEVLPNVFELFVQDAHAAAANGSGLGIGLAVVRQLVEAHGGTVAASSGGKGLGSEFVVTLPLADDAT